MTCWDELTSHYCYSNVYLNKTCALYHELYCVTLVHSDKLDKKILLNSNPLYRIKLSLTCGHYLPMYIKLNYQYFKLKQIF